MGGSQVKNANPNPLTKITIDIVCAKVRQYIVVERDRKIEQLFRQEGRLLESVKKTHLEVTELRTNAVSNINLLKWIQGANMVYHYVKILEAHSLALERGQYNPQEIAELLPSISSVIWSTGPLNLTAINEFNYLVNRHFSQTLYQEARAGKNVDEKLKKNFATLLPTAFEIDDYLKDFFRRHGDQIDDNMRKEHLNSMMKYNKEHGGKYGAPPSNYDPSDINTKKGDQTTIISNFNGDTNNTGIDPNDPNNFSQGN